MKLAICVSGKYSEVWEQNDTENVLKEYFEKDNFLLEDFKIFTATWDDVEVETDWKFSEPEMHYHPGIAADAVPPKSYNQFIRNGKAKSDLWKHRTKQILAHAMILNMIPLDYDMIIRTRFDVKLSDVVKKIDIMHLLQKSYEKKVPIGFQTPKHKHTTIDNLEILKFGHPREEKYIPDHLIMHHRNCFDPFYVNEMHLSGKLLPAEYGWYQALCKDSDNHLSILGFSGVK